MEKCPTCGAERRREGVMYPARLLCPCEVRTCSSDDCEDKAVVVEFQAAVKGAEPRLPKTKNTTARFLCVEHAPYGLVPEAAPPPPKKVTKRTGNIDPAWTLNMPPPGAMSPAMVECWKCHDVHPLKSRKMHNGTESNCPKCGDNMHTPAE